MVSYTEVLAVTLEKYKEVFLNASHQVLHTTLCATAIRFVLNKNFLIYLPVDGHSGFHSFCGEHYNLAI